MEQKNIAQIEKPLPVKAFLKEHGLGSWSKFRAKPLPEQLKLIGSCWELKYNNEIDKGNWNIALEIAKKHNLGQEKVQVAALNCYLCYMILGDLHKAARIAKQCDLGQEKVMVPALKIYRREMGLQAAFVAMEYGLGTEAAKSAILNKYYERLGLLRSGPEEAENFRHYVGKHGYIITPVGRSAKIEIDKELEIKKRWL